MQAFNQRLITPIIWLASGMLLWLAVFLFQTALANYRSDRAEAIMNRWGFIKPPHSIPPRDIRLVHRLLAESPGLSPPERHAQIVQLNLWRMTNPAMSLPERQRLNDEALKHARQDVYDRPVWPLAWARLMLCKIQRAEYDGEFKRALERTTTLGQWQRRLHLVVLEATLPVYPQLASEDRQRILDTAVRGLKQSRPMVLAYLNAYGRLNEVCARIPREDPLRQTACQDPPSTP